MANLTILTTTIIKIPINTRTHPFSIRTSYSMIIGFTLQLWENFNTKILENHQKYCMYTTFQLVRGIPYKNDDKLSRLQELHYRSTLNYWNGNLLLPSSPFHFPRLLSHNNSMYLKSHGHVLPAFDKVLWLAARQEMHMVSEYPVQV